MLPKSKSIRQHCRINASKTEKCSTMNEKKISQQENDEMIEISGEISSRTRNDETVLLGFAEYASDGCNRFDQSTAESSFNRAIAECNIIRSNPCFSEGILLKSIDSNPLYPYLHYVLFKNPDQDTRIAQIDRTIREIHGRPNSQFGAYDQISAIQKTSLIADHKIPLQRHAGYIIILFKLLDEQTRYENLEKTWFSWTGAREIYKYSPRNWNLRRIVLQRLLTAKRKNFRPFAYVLFCEFGSILNPSNRLHALDMVERLRMRNCGYISLYQVQFSYGKMSTSNESTSSSNSEKLFSLSHAKWKRHLMLRGFSQEAEPRADISQLANTTTNTSTTTTTTATTTKQSDHSAGAKNDKQSIFHSSRHFNNFE